MKILIGTPCYDNKIDSRMVASVLNIINICKEKNVSLNWDRPSSPILAYNRNLIVQTALEEKYDWILFWDADISVDDNEFIFRIIDTAYKYDTPVVGIPIRLKHPSEKKWNFANKIMNKYINGTGDLVKDPFFVDVIGTGLMLIRVNKLYELTPPWFHFQDIYEQGRIGFFPEDWFFCEKIKEKGYKIIVDPQIKATHWGTYPFHD